MPKSNIKYINVWADINSKEKIKKKWNINNNLYIFYSWLTTLVYSLRNILNQLCVGEVGGGVWAENTVVDLGLFI